MSGDESLHRFDVVAETRRQWSLEEKLTIVAESSGPSVNISAVARQHGLKPALLYRWRKELGGTVPTSSAATFVPVAIAAPVPGIESPNHGRSDTTVLSTPKDPKKPAWFEIELANGRRIRIGSGVEPQHLKRIIDALED